MTASTRAANSPQKDGWAAWADRPPAPATRPAEEPRPPEAPGAPRSAAAPGAPRRSVTIRPRAASAARTGRRPGGEDTRGRILAAARAAFGEHGFDGATIRDVAARAHVDPALVHHYFGSKQQLFVTAMEIPVDFERAETLLAGPREDLGERFIQFVLGLWETPPMQSLILGLVRSAASDEVAAGMLRRMLAEGPFLVLAHHIDLPDASLRATLVGSQVVGIGMARYVVRVEPLASADPEVLARAIGPAIQHYLTGDLGGS